MSDFSAYNGASDEWLAIQATLPNSVDPSTEDELNALRDATNKTREEAAAKGLAIFASRLELENHSIPTRDGQTLSARFYKPTAATAATGPRPTYVHLHGGGFLFGSLSSEDATCARIATEANVDVLNVSYRHTPEYRYPTAWDDVEDALAWLAVIFEKYDVPNRQVILGGTSAGAWLSASQLVREGRPSGLEILGQVLMIPCLAFPGCNGPQKAKLKDLNSSSYVKNFDAPILPSKRVKLFSTLMGVENPDEDDLCLNPGNASQEAVKHLPPTVVGVAGLDMLRDEGLLFAKMLHDAG